MQRFAAATRWDRRIARHKLKRPDGRGFIRAAMVWLQARPQLGIDVFARHVLDGRTGERLRRVNGGLRRGCYARAPPH
jgi:hypothetical protein